MATPFTTVQFEDFYDVYKMRALVDDLERQFATLQVDVTSGGGGVTVHNDLTGRSASDTHPISSITGLVSALAAKADQTTVDAIDLRVTANEAELARNRIERYFLGE
ncbi:MAG: hypothetical protein QGD91_10235 [Actinomycetota bacterium]|nr:hypothetical protein [Actinomycetota bacterium]